MMAREAGFQGSGINVDGQPQEQNYTSGRFYQDEELFLPNKFLLSYSYEKPIYSILFILKKRSHLWLQAIRRMQIWGTASAMEMVKLDKTVDWAWLTMA